MAKKRSFIGIYDWEEINFTSEAKGWEKFETNNESIALNVFFPIRNKEE